MSEVRGIVWSFGRLALALALALVLAIFSIQLIQGKGRRDNPWLTETL
jgi:hypothetical protein